MKSQFRLFKGNGFCMGLKADLKKTSIGFIPKDWSIVKLGDVCEIYQPKTISRKEAAKASQWFF